MLCGNNLCACPGGAKSDGDVPATGAEDSGLGNERGYTSDSELMYGDTRSPKHVPSRPLSPADTLASSNSSPGGWILVRPFQQNRKCVFTLLLLHRSAEKVKYNPCTWEQCLSISSVLCTSENCWPMTPMLSSSVSRVLLSWCETWLT